MLVFDDELYSPDRSENPAGSKTSFSWQKTTTNGSSFYDLEKQFLNRGVATNSWIGSKKNQPQLKLDL